jgi:hypothetical protein
MKRPRGETSTPTELRALIVDTANLSLQTSSATRRLTGSIEKFALLPSDSTIAIDGLAAAAGYHSNKSKGANGQYPPPYVYVWAAVVAALLKTGKLSPDDVHVLQTHATSAQDPFALAADVHSCMVRTTRDVGFVKISFSTSQSLSTVEQALLRGIVANGGQPKFWPVPRGFLERSIAPSLADLGEFPSGQ